MAAYRFFGSSTLPSRSLPATAELESDTITDTGIRMTVRAQLALCRHRGTDHVAYVCGSCGQLTATLEAWSCCATCGEALTELLPTNRPATTYWVDWRTGRCTETPELRKVTAPPSKEKDLQDLPPADPLKGMICLLNRPNTIRYSCSRSRVTGKPNAETSRSPTGQDIVARQPAPIEEALPTPDPASIRSESPELPAPASEAPMSPASASPPTGKQWELEGAAGGERGDTTTPTPVWLQDKEEEEGEWPGESKWAEEVIQLRQCAENLGLSQAYAERRPELSPPRTWSQTRNHNQAHSELVQRSGESYVPTGRGIIEELPRLSRFQRVVQKRVLIEYGLEYPYVPESVIDEVEEKRKQWCEEAVWEYLGVPKPARNPEFPRFWEVFQKCSHNWNYGRSIHKDKIVIRRPNLADQISFITLLNERQELVKLPNPLMYR